MTANRWWVRKAARWLARIDGVSGQLRLAMLVMTGLSTATLTLRQYGYGQYAWPVIGITFVGMALFAYLYTEGGVWNQMQRDRRDLSNNFAGPNARIVNEMLVRSLIAALQDDNITKEQRKLIQNELDDAFFELRDGVTLDPEKNSKN